MGPPPAPDRVEFDVTTDDLLAFGLEHHRRSPTAKRLFWVSLLAPPVLWTGGLAGLASRLDVPFGQAVYGLWPLFAAGPLYLVLFAGWHPVLTRWLLSRSLAEGANRALLGRQSLTVDDDGITMTSEFGTSHLKWGAVDRIVVTAEHVCLYVSALSAFVIPRRAFPTPDAVDAFVARVRAAVAARAPEAGPVAR